MKKTKKWILALVAAAALIAFILTNPLFACLRSMAVMSVYSGACEKEGIPASEGIDIKIPSGKGWYPFVMTYNADGAFARCTGEEGARLTILYNFPAFDHLRGCSRLFDETSPFYNSFYGAYLTQLPSGKVYGFGPDEVDLEEAVSTVAQLDFFGLVLEDFGLTKQEQVFEYSAGAVTESLYFAGTDGWTKLTADIRVNGSGHEAMKGVRSYWQYGRPNFPVTGAFAPVDMKCTVYARYFAEWNTTVFFYVMAADEKVMNDCIENILSTSTLK